MLSRDQYPVCAPLKHELSVSSGAQCLNWTPLIKKKEGTCSHDVACSDCKRVVNWLLHDTEKKSQYSRICPPQNIRCGECHHEYQCLYCLNLASKLRLIFYDKNGGHYNHGGIVVEVEPYLARVLRHRFPEEVSKGLRIGLVSGYYGPMALDGVWLTAFEKGNHTAPGLIRSITPGPSKSTNSGFCLSSVKSPMGCAKDKTSVTYLLEKICIC
jgi:hypothetical protein